MELTNERKVFVGFLGLALCALGVDRVLLQGGPQPADASELIAGADAQSVSAPRTLPPNLTQKVASLIDHVGTDTSDGFEIPASMAAPASVEVRTSEPAPPVVLKLTAVSGVHGARPVARINGRTLTLNQTDARSGMTLLSLRETDGEIEASVLLADGTTAVTRLRPGADGEETPWPAASSPK